MAFSREVTFATLPSGTSSHVTAPQGLTDTPEVNVTGTFRQNQLLYVCVLVGKGVIGDGRKTGSVV